MADDTRAPEGAAPPAADGAPAPSDRDRLKDAALEFHKKPTPGKISVVPTKPLSTQRDLALAYSPGVAYACEAIVDEPLAALDMTARGNLVGVVTNGTAVLGLGPIGPLASKPVMEGKGVLFKKFADIDVFDIEIAETDPDRLVDIIASLEPTFGGINLEDIKAPECFEIEQKLRARCNIPIFHDDQHGTAIIVAAAIVNGLKVIEKDLASVRLVTAGAGAAAIACLDLLVDMGMPVDNIWVTDLHGVVHEGRAVDMEPRKARYAKRTEARCLGDIIAGADIFLGLSAPGVLKLDWVARMADRPLILALANPTPEIMPDQVRAVRSDAVVATGRSDFPNQVNNVLCFPYIFRGALDVGASAINEAMKIACVEAIAGLALQEPNETVAAAYGDQTLQFGPDYLIPKPFDPRLIVEVAPAVAKAAMDSGVAARPIGDFTAYRERLGQFVYRSGLVMRPIIARARETPKRIAFAEGEEPRVLRAVQTLVDDGLCRPILIGRRGVLESRIQSLTLRLDLDREVEVVDPEQDARYDDYSANYHAFMGRRGVSPARARTVVRTNTTVIAALMVAKGDADALIAGTVGPYRTHLVDVVNVLGLREGVITPAALSALILPRGTVFVADPYVVPNPSVEQLADITELAAEEVRRFGIEPKVAMLSHSNFGTMNDADALRMRDAVALVKQRLPDLEVDGEMHADAALVPELRAQYLPDSVLNGPANLLIMPDMDAANITFNLFKVLEDCVTIGPMLLGVHKPAHICTPSATTRGIVNLAAVACVDAQIAAQRGVTGIGHHQGYNPLRTWNG